MQQQQQSLTQATPSTAGAAPPPYINPNGQMVNYGPPPVQYTPVTVPIPVSLVGVHDSPGGPPYVPQPPPAAAINPHQLAAAAALASTPEQQQQVLMAAAAAAGAAAAPPSGGPGYAEVRGGVTYFNQPPMVNPHQTMPHHHQQVSKRPKAAIPIVDPSEVTGNAKTASSSSDVSPQNSLEGDKSDATKVLASKT